MMGSGYDDGGDGGGADGVDRVPRIVILVRATRRRCYSRSRAIKHSIKKKMLGKEATAEKKTAGKDNQSAFSLSIYECALSSCNNVDKHRRAAVVERGRGVPGSGDSWAKPNQVGANASHQQSP